MGRRFTNVRETTTSERGTLKRERGYVLMTMAVTMIAICGFAGLVMDTGYAEYTRRQAQAAADAAAKAAALEILAGQTSAINAAALQDATNNGFTAGGTPGQAGYVTVTVNHPPLFGSYLGNNSYAEVIVSKTLPTSFMSILGFATTNVTARGVGGGGGGGACIYALAGTDTGQTHNVQDALLASGSAQVNSGCGIIDESTNSKALETSGSACLTGTSIQVVGNDSGSCISPSPATGITSPGDPLRTKFTAPYSNTSPPSTCDYTGWHNVSTTLSPGVYCGGIVADGGATYTVSPGMYVLYGGGLTVSGNGTNVITSATGGSNTGGATFFNMDSGGQYGGYKPIVVSGGGSTVMNAPTSGSYEGLLFWQDPTLPSTDWNKQNTVSGGSSTQFNGILYFPDSPLYYSGGSTQNGGYTIIVADTINFSGPSSLNANYSALSGGNPIKSNAIVAE
jgi:Flp pilus assembly protein TadG